MDLGAYDPESLGGPRSNTGEGASPKKCRASAVALRQRRRPHPPTTQSRHACSYLVVVRILIGVQMKLGVNVLGGPGEQLYRALNGPGPWLFIGEAAERSVADLIPWGKKSDRQDTCQVLKRSSVIAATGRTLQGPAQGRPRPMLVFVFVVFAKFHGDRSLGGWGRIRF